MQRRIEINRRTYVTFIDLQKAVDKVDLNLVFQMTMKKGLDWKDRMLILNIYKLKTQKYVSRKEIKIWRGITYGHPLSFYLFNLFIENAIV